MELGDLDDIQVYTVVEAKTVNELVKLTNLKTKNGWNCLGGMCYAPNNFCESDSQTYAFCQSMFRMEKPKNEKPVKKFVAFPYKEEKKEEKKEKFVAGNYPGPKRPIETNPELKQNYKKTKYKNKLKYVPQHTTKNK